LYRQRAEAWRQKTALLPEDHEEAALCLEIAEGYAKLASALAAKNSTSAEISPIPPAKSARNSRKKIAPAREI
jgi:hypothetical protein